MPKTRFTADLEIELYEWIMKYKEQTGMSRNEALSEAVQLLKKKRGG